jgi:hypothetical protein
MAPRAAAPLALALLLLPLAAPLASPAQAQGAPPATPFEPQPAELREVGQAWLARAEATIAAFAAAHPQQNTTILWVFHEGAADYLNESRLLLAVTQLLQLEAQAAFQGFFPALAEEERRNASLARAVAEEERSRTALAAAQERLVRVDGALRTTHGLEYALLAAVLLGIGDDLARDAPNATRQLSQAPAAEERIVRSTLYVAGSGQHHARMAQDLLDLTERVDADPARPRLPEGARSELSRWLDNRLNTDSDASSITGQASARALPLLQEASASKVASVHLARFLAYEQARTNDALQFRRSQGTLNDALFARALGEVVANASLAPNYDGNLVRVAPPGHLAALRAAGYHGVFEVDAMNHARYRLQWDTDAEGVTRFPGALAAWSQLVAARYHAEALQEMPAPRPAAQGGSDVLLYAGIAVVAALAVVAVAFLRKPAGP